MNFAIPYAAGIGLAVGAATADAMVGTKPGTDADGVGIGDTCDASVYCPVRGFEGGAEVRPAASLILVVPVGRDNPAPKSPEKMLNALADLAPALRGCWWPPRLGDVASPPDVTFQISFRRDGRLFGRPRIIEFSRAVTRIERAIYYQAVARALELCSSLPFNDGLGGAIAGRTIRVVFKDQRNKRQALR